MIRKGLRHKTRLFFAFHIDTERADAKIHRVEPSDDDEHTARATHDDALQPLLVGITGRLYVSP